MKWFAVLTNARAEWMAHQELRRQGYDTLYLHYMGTVSHANRKIGVLKPYFPRYLFVGVEPGQSIGKVNKTQGVSTVVYFGDEPLAVPDRVMDELRAKGNRDGLVDVPAAPVRERLERGTQVTLESGPFAGFIATVSLDRGASIVVWLRSFGDRLIPLTVGPEDVEPLNPTGGACQSLR
jgi:transcriptional antiterminator RfaH